MVVSAWPEPPYAKSAGAPCGVWGTFAVGGIETPPNSLGRKKAAFKLAFNFPSELFWVQGQTRTVLLARFVARGPRGGVAVGGPRSVAVRGPSGGVWP